MTQGRMPDQPEPQRGSPGAASTDPAESFIMLFSGVVALAPTLFVANLIWHVDWLWNLGHPGRVYKTGIFSLVFGSLITFAVAFAVMLAISYSILAGIRAVANALRRN